MLHCFSRRAKLLKATATNYKHACTCKHSSQPLSTPWSRSKLSLPKLKASLVACFPSCRKLLSQVSKTPALAENFCSKPKRPATNQILLRTAKTFQDCRKLRKQLGSRRYSHRTTSAAQMLTFSLQRKCAAVCKTGKCPESWQQLFSHQKLKFESKTAEFKKRFCLRLT